MFFRQAMICNSCEPDVCEFVLFPVQCRKYGTQDSRSVCIYRVRFVNWAECLMVREETPASFLEWAFVSKPEAERHFAATCVRKRCNTDMAISPQAKKGIRKRIHFR